MNNVLEQLNGKMKDEYAEAEVLSMLIGSENSPVTPLDQADIMTLLKPEYFTVPTYSELFSVISEMYAIGRDLLI